MVCKDLRPVFGRLPGPNRAWLLVVVYFSCQASQLLVYQSRHYHVYMPNTYQARKGVDPYRTGGGMLMSPQYFRRDVVYNVDSSDSNCCLLYFNANIMCIFTKKVPQPPYRGSRPQSSFMSSQIIL